MRRQINLIEEASIDRNLPAVRLRMVRPDLSRVNVAFCDVMEAALVIEDELPVSP